MADLHLRDIPEELYERLRERARAENRSLSAEVITLLDSALQPPERPQAEILESINRRRFFRPADVGAPDSLSLLREDRER
jgi:plasmid stability protein